MGEDVLVEFAEPGQYKVALYNLAGQLIGQKSANIVSGSNVQLRLGQPGTYVLKVTQGNKLVRSVKLLKK